MASTTDISGEALDRKNKAQLFAQRFQEQIAAQGDKTVFVGRPENITYGRLEEMVNRVGEVFQRHGIQPGDRVGLSLKRGPVLIAAMAACLKSGVTYVPIDNNYPPQKMKYVCQHSDLKLLFWDEPGMAAAAFCSCASVNLDNWMETKNPAFQPAWPVAKPDHIAYIMYTSGTTGDPKGVQISQKALAQFLTEFPASLGLEQNDVFLSMTSISFDISGVELVLPLVLGAQIFFADKTEALNQSRLEEQIRQNHISVVQMTPLMWREFINNGLDGPKLGEVKKLCGGETMSQLVARRLLEGDRKGLWNLYGPTEATIWAFTHRVTEEDLRETSISIGKPMPGVIAEIRDGGEEGELLLGGAFLADGYFGRPDLTADKFGHFNDRDYLLYSTGDLVKRLPDGRFEFYGRNDDQIKIQGNRLELSSITFLLDGMKEIKSSAVILNEEKDEEGETKKKILAFCVPQPGFSPTAAEIRHHLSQSLPLAALPSKIVFVEEIPKSSSGKVDREKLKKHLGAAAAGSQSSKEPQTEDLAALFGEILKKTGVGPDDDFFDIGGDSFNVTELTLSIEKKFNLKIPVPEIILHGTPSGITDWISKHQATKTRSLS
jgi:amino acid adenylation domain-containing protein